MLLLGLGNKARQGKDTVANFVKDLLPATKLYSFASELKLYCKEHHDELLPQWQIANQTKQLPACKEDPIYGYSPILQWYGTDVTRKKDPNFWIKKVEERVKKDNPQAAVITDVRFPNECEFVKNLNGTLVQVIRQLPGGLQYIDPNRDPSHITETALDDYLGWDYILTAKDGDLEALQSKTNGVVYSILGRSFAASMPNTRPRLGQETSISDATGFSN